VRALLLALLILVLGTHVSAAPQPGRVHFTAVGDFASTTNAGAVLTKIDALDSDFTLALGDLSYGAATAEETWCNFVKARVGQGYPFELVSGNHESNGQNGDINDFAACLPNQLPGAIGTYGKQYYVDVPADNPIVRFVMISPGLPFPDGNTDYSEGSARYLWTAQAIDSARASGVPWVVVGMHKPCITVGKYLCESGSDVFNLLLEKKVDLILSGHEHTYQRSHQLAQRSGCTTLAPQPAAYDSDCVVDTDGTFAAGAGSVAMVVGTGGNSLYDITAGDPESNYFAATAGLNKSPTWGALDVTATDQSLQASFAQAAGASFSDSFTITRSTTSNVPPVAAFTPSCTNLACTFDGAGSSDSDGTIADYAWNFGDGTPAGSGPSTSHTFAAAGSYTVRLTVTDDAGGTGTTTRNVTVAVPTTNYASDQFTRTVTNGLGTAPAGGNWTYTGDPVNLSVAGGTGGIRLNKGVGQSVYLASVSAPSSDTVLRFALDKAATGGGVHVSALGRRVSGQGAYAGKAKIASNGSVALELIRQSGTGAETSIQAGLGSGVTYAPGDTLNLRVQVLNTAPTTIRAKVWKVGTVEPSTWLRSVTDSTSALQGAGSVGVTGYVSSSATDVPLTIKLDELTVVAAP
jgi:PKD repeat protein